MDRELWVKSGHIENLGENMFMTQTPDERVFALKPMNCPGHIQVFKQGLQQLPWRAAAAFRRVWRRAPLRAFRRIASGSCAYGPLPRMMRTFSARSIRSRPESIAVTKLILSIYRDFGFEDVRIKFSDRPARRVGSDEIWDKRSEAALALCLA